jgi:hypothetical protein
VLEREVTRTLLGHGLNADAARAAAWHLRGQFADATRRVGRKLAFPRQAPQLWTEAKQEGIKIRDFIEATYGMYVREYGMTRADVRRLDASAVKALENWVNDQRRRLGNAVDIEDILPKGTADPDTVEAELKASGKTVEASDWRGYRGDEPVPPGESSDVLGRVIEAERRRRAHAARRKRKSRAEKAKRNPD